MASCPICNATIALAAASCMPGLGWALHGLIHRGYKLVGRDEDFGDIKR